MIINPANLNFAFFGLKTLFQQIYESTPIHWPEVATEIPSGTETEYHAWLQVQPDLNEWLGDRYIANLVANSYALTNKTFQGAFAVPRSKFEDDQYGIFTSQSVKNLGEAAKVYPDKQIAAALVAGTTAIGYDGQAIFSASHPVVPGLTGSATQSNLITSNALTLTGLQTARAQGNSFLNEAGYPFELDFSHLIVPPSLETAAKQLADSEFLAPSGATVGLQAGTLATAVGAVATNPFKGKLKVTVLPRLSNTDTTNAWYLADTGRAIKPLIWQNRMAPEFTYLNKPDDPNVFMQDKYVYGVRARGVAGYGPYFLMIKSTP